MGEDGLGDGGSALELCLEGFEGVVESVLFEEGLDEFGSLSHDSKLYYLK